MEYREQTVNGVFEWLDEGMRYVRDWTPTIINDGGCGIFALLLYDHFEAIGIQSQILAYVRKGYRDLVEDNLIEFVNNHTGPEYAGALHVILKIPYEDTQVYIDSDGINNDELMRLVNSQCGLEMSKQQLRDLWERSHVWNEIFDRKQIPVIVEKLNSVFETYPIILQSKPVTFMLPKERVMYSGYTQRRVDALTLWW